MRRGASKPTHPGGRLGVLAALFLAFACALALATPALALEAGDEVVVNKATARPNEDGGDSVIGGMKTRLTWEATLNVSEGVSSVTLQLPEGSKVDDSTTRVTVLEGLNRINIDSNVNASGTTVQVDFAEPIPSGSLLRLEVTDMEFPSAGGDYTVGGTFTTASGETADLDASPAISIIELTPLQAMVSWLDDQAWVEAWNSVPFLNMFFKPQLLVTSFASLFNGWLLCLAIVFISYPFAILLGLVFAFMRISKHIVWRGISSVYINLIRGTPMFLQIYVAFFGLPMMGINMDNTVLGIIVCAINSSAYLAEIFRAGIQSIPRGQYEASYSLGMSNMQTMVHVILPQTIRRVIPTITSDFITNYKDTSLLSSVGVMELMMFAKNLVTVAGNITPYIAAAIYYLIVTLPLIKVVGIIEKHLAITESGGGPHPKGRKATSPELIDQIRKGDEGRFERPDDAKDAADAVDAKLSSVMGALMAPFRPTRVPAVVLDEKEA